MNLETVPVNREEFQRLVSPVPDRDKPRYSWHAFKHSYSKELVDKIIDEFGIPEDGRVLDPFCGGGTTLLACKERNLEAVGYDILPFSVFLSNVKTTDFEAEKLEKALSTFRVIRTSNELPDVKIVDKAFTPAVQETIMGIKTWIETLPNKKEAEFFLLALLTTVDKVSRATKSGGFLRIVKKSQTQNRTVNVFLETSRKMIEDVKKLPLKEKSGAKAHLGDARKIPKRGKYDAVITSPPYPNRHDYTRIYALELLTAFTNSNKELKELRYRTLRSHVEARETIVAKGYSQPQLLTYKLDELGKRKMNNSQIIPMLEGYFEDMYLVLKQIKRDLKKGGRAALVVSNVRYEGVSIPVDEILAEIGVKAGLKNASILKARDRGNSSQQMEKYSREPARESIIVWKNA
ncbi:Modification methylase MjaII [Candidatus Norongarragalina meridionalis]|nr:Modification methylase MjaII [Candidatus Norongarragalina meridionalis]